MRLIKCYVENYGKLSDFSYSFNQGINVIEQENGWGKTTFASFIKAMLFGLEYKIGKTVTERKRYMPWNGNRFGGNLEFEVGGKQYRVERYFGEKEKDDTFVLYDLLTNTRSDDFSENLGVEILDVDRDSYEKTAFINLENSELLNEIIQKKLGGIDEKTVDLELFGRAKELLTKLANEVKGKRKNTGKIGELEQQQLELKKAMGDAANAQRSIEVVNRFIQELNEKYQEKIGKLKAADEQLMKFSAFERAEAYRQVVSRVDNGKKELDEITAVFDKKIPTADEISLLEAQVYEWKRLSENKGETKERVLALAEKYQDKTDKLDIVSNYLSNIQKIEAHAGCRNNHLWIFVKIN